MTRDEVLAMKPGPEMDLLVALEIMGWQGPVVWIDDPDDGRLPYLYPPGVEPGEDKDQEMRATDCCVEPYTTLIGGAWEVAEQIDLFKAHSIGQVLVPVDNGPAEWKWCFQDDLGEEIIICDTAMEAICKAALLATIEVHS